MTPSISVTEKPPSADTRRAWAASLCASVSSTLAWAGLGVAKRFSGIATATSTPASIRPSITALEHLASAASVALARTWPSVAIFTARWRAGVMRGGSAAPALYCTPKRGFCGSKTAGAPIVMRTTMPSGDNV